MGLSRVLAMVVTLTMVFTVLAAFPMGASAASMTDAAFFAKLNYDAYPELGLVKAAVDRKDYDRAKAELLKYLKARHADGKITGNGVTEADENYGMAVLPMRNILTGPYEFDMWQAEFTVTDKNFKDYSIDVTDRVRHELANGAVSFMLMAGNKQRYPVIVKSKEAGGVGPRLVVKLSDGTDETIGADQDTYISSKDTKTDYGAAAELYVKEDADNGNNSTGENTRRAYMNFSLGKVANKEITSAALVVNAAYANDCATGPKDVLVINIGDTTWNESKHTWDAIKGNIYSYENLDEPIWNANAPNADSEYHNVTSRFWFGKPMAYEYLSYLKMGEKAYNDSHPYHEQYPGDEFGPKLVDLMNAFATQMNYGWTRTLETGERLNRWVDIVDAFLGTNVFDDKLDELVNILSFMWGDCNYLNGLDITSDGPWWSNWKLVANAGFFKAVEFLPELKDHDAFRERVEGNVEYTMDFLFNDDMSFKEAGPSYGEWCMKLYGDCLIAAEKSDNPVSASFKTKLIYAARNAAQSFFPDGWDSNVGDSNYRDKMSEFKLIAEYLDDPMLDAYVNGDGSYEGEKSVLYNDVNSVYMRTSWDPKETTYVSFSNNPNDGHAHPDSNQVLMYAYGKPLLVDSGRYGYANPNNSIYTELRYASAHNTVEAEGVSMGGNNNYHSSSAEKISSYADNDLFTFAASTQHGYPNTKHTRNVLFLKRLGGGVTFVTDYVDGNKAGQVYRQNWHFMPSSNAAVGADGHSVSTNFAGEANVDLYNADADASTEIKDGYFSADYGLVANSKYGSFKKTGEDVKFGTVIVPRRAGEAAKNITVTDKAKDNNSSAVSMTTPLRGSDSRKFDYTVYVKNNANADGAFGEYKTDAKAAIVMDGINGEEGTQAGPVQYGIVNGKTLTKNGQVIIESSAELNSIGVEQTGLTSPGLAITGENLAPNTDKTKAIKIYAGGAVESVTLNGEDIKFEQDGDYVYAVGVGSVTTVDETVISADKDGFVAYKDNKETNEGKTDRGIIQAAISDWAARNAYAAFDLEKYSVDDFDKAVLRMVVTEAANGGNIHFYWMDYGTWTRDNLQFVVNNGKMPTFKNSGEIKDGEASFKGYPYRLQANVGSLKVGDTLEVDITDSLKGYLTNGNNVNPSLSKKFTLAMLSQTGSTKFASLENGTYPGPAIVLSTSTTEGEKRETKVTVKFLDDKNNEIKNAETVTSGLQNGKLYTYDAPETVVYNGVTYYLDKADSSLSVMITEGGAYDLTAKYVPAAEVKVRFTHNGEPVADGDSVYVMPGSTYTFAPETVYTFDGQTYLTDTERSTLTVKAASDAENAIVVALAEIQLGENIIKNGSFETDTDGWTSYNNGIKALGSNWARSKDYAKDGSYSLHVNQSQENTWTGSNDNNNLQTYFKLEPNKKYLLTFSEYWTQAVSSSNSGHMNAATVSAGYGTSNHKPAAGGWSSWDTGGVNRTLAREANKWLTYAYLLDTSNADVVNAAEIYATIAYSMNQCTSLYIDDFSLCEIVDSEIKTAQITVRYVDEKGEELAAAESFTARVGDSYDAEPYVIDALHRNKTVYAFDSGATGEITGEVTGDKQIDMVYSSAAYDGVLLDLSFDGADSGFAGGEGTARYRGKSPVFAAGVKGQALSLNGSGTNWLSAALTGGGSLLTGVQEMTVSFYGKVNNAEGPNWPFFAAPNTDAQNSNNEHYLGGLEKNGLTVERYNNSGSRPVNASVANTGTDWKLITVVFKEASTEIYIDGALKASQASGYELGDILGNRSVFQIGKANWGNGEYYNGLIDEFKVFDYALTAEEVLDLVRIPTLTFDGAKAAALSPDADCQLIVAQYDKDGKLLKTESKAVKAGEMTELTLVKSEGAASATAFLWDGVKTMKPLTKDINVKL